MKSNLTIFALISLMALSAWADDLDNIQKKGEIVIGVRKDAPPFSFFNKTHHTVSGYDVAFGQYIARKLGVKPVFKALDPADRIPTLQNGKIDLIIGALAKTVEREKILEFSLGYFVAMQKLAAKPGRFRNLLDLNNTKVCFAQGTTAEQWLADHLPKVIPVPTPDYPQAFNTWQAGGCEAIAGQGTILEGNINKLSSDTSIDVLDDFPLGMEIFSMGMRKGEKRLQQQINEILIESERTGEAARIYERYFGEESAVPQVRMFKIHG